MSAYRGREEDRVELVKLGVSRGLYVVSAVGLAFLAFMLVMTAPCERLSCAPGGACRLEMWHLVHVATDVEVFPALDLQRAEVDTLTDEEGGDATGVVLVVAGRRILLNDHSNIEDDVKARWVAEIRAWIDGGRREPLELFHDRSWVALVGLPFLLAAIVFHAGFGLRATVDRRAGVFTASRFRWLPPQHRLDLARVRGVRIAEEMGSDGDPVCGIELVVADAAPVRLTGMSSGGREAKQRFVEELEAALRGDAQPEV